MIPTGNVSCIYSVKFSNLHLTALNVEQIYCIGRALLFLVIHTWHSDMRFSKVVLLSNNPDLDTGQTVVPIKG